MRLIDADALQERLQRKKPGIANGRHTEGFNEALLKFKSMIHGAKTIEAVPVVRGEWVVTDAYPHRVYCSLCYKTNVLNEEWLYEKNDYPKYCMWCGAKMEVEHETD